MSTPALRVAVDIGGTFTDLVVFDPATGVTSEAKASTTPGDFAAGVLDSMVNGGVTPTEIAFLVHGTTVVINAITQRRGVKTALVTTRGFRDALAIGRGNRPDMYNLKFRKPEPFVPRRLRFEVTERLLQDGTVERPLEMADLESVAVACEQQGVEALAICFLHAYAHPAHEQAAASFLRERLPGVAVSASSEITKEWREYERSSTVVLNAYVQPILDRYLGTLEARLRERDVEAQLHVMQSNGGTATFDAAREQAIQLVESGPAAGVIGARLVGEQLGIGNVISLDVGGTTAKCSLIQGGDIRISEDYRLEHTPLSPGYPVKIPVVDIVEIGAGGGSIVWFDEGGAFRVGPISAGADPGPAAYGKGGTQPTVTDAMLIAGVISSDSFMGGRLVLNRDLSREAFAPIAARLGTTVEEAAAGAIRLANELTIDALKLISVRRGFDPRDFALVAFGGGGPMHAAFLGQELGVQSIVIPPMPGTFSAWGMLMTDPRIDLARTRVIDLDSADGAACLAIFEAMEGEALERFERQGLDTGTLAHQWLLDMRYVGQEHTVRVPIFGPWDRDRLATDFHEHHRRRYTFALDVNPIQIVAFRTISTVVQSRPTHQFDSGRSTRSVPSGTRLVDPGSGIPVPARVFQRSALATGEHLAGPVIVEEPGSTTLVLESQSVVLDAFGNLIISATH
jgi:N-methylhydantoinase A